MIPDNIMDGKNMIIAIIVNFACCLNNNPITHPKANVTESSTISDIKYHNKLFGSSALNTSGEITKISKQTIIVCIKEEINCVTIPK